MENNADKEQFLFSEKLKFYLKQNNLNLKEFSEKIEVPVSTVHGWINGVPPRNIITLKRISSLLGISLEEMCFGPILKKEKVESDLVISIGQKKFRLILEKIDK